jgi:quinol monooxygenase YgiN
VIVVNRFRVDEGAADEFAADVHRAHAVLAEQVGYVDGRVGRNVDDPGLWVLTTTWVNVGSYRRALSAYDVKVTAVPLLSRALDEPSAYETVADDGQRTNEARPRTTGWSSAD